MNVLDKVQVFTEIVFNKEKVPSFQRFCCTKVGHVALFCIFEEPRVHKSHNGHAFMISMNESKIYKRVL